MSQTESGSLMSVGVYLRSLLVRQGRQPAPAAANTAVADYWTRYNVTLHHNFTSGAESLAYVQWRNDQYFGYLDLMPVDAQEGKVVLDFGCGPGHDLVGFATNSRPARLIAMDASPSSICEARARLALHRAACEFIQLNPHSTHLPLDAASVDYVHSSGVLHHLPDAGPVLREFRRVLRPNGSARIMVYNYDSVWMHLFVAYMKRIVEKSYANVTLEEAFARTTDGEDCPIARVFRPEEFIALAGQASFDAVFTGAAVSIHEAKILPYRFDAIQDRRTPEASRRFLLELTYDEYGMPWYRGHRAGLDACFLLTPR
jgi:ubiquinone/menaquinone biosynthesis C-methylase UbiE